MLELEKIFWAKLVQGVIGSTPGALGGWARGGEIVTVG